MGNPLQSYGASPAIWDHTCHLTQVNTPTLTPARQASTRFTYPGGMEGWVEWQSGIYLIATRPGIKPTTSLSQVRYPTPLQY